MKLPVDISRDLAGVIEGEVLIDEAVRNVYATAACIYRIMPLAVLRPRNAADVAAIVRYAADSGVPVTPRGAGSAVAGQSIGPGIIIDFAPHMRSIIEIGDDFVDVEPGVVLDKLNATLARLGRKFAPDPSSGPYCTLGGMIANNSSGARNIRYGSTRNHIVDIEAVTANGDIINIGEGEDTVDKLRSMIGGLIRENTITIGTHRSAVTKNSSGYNIWDIVREDGGVDLSRLICGSEGTLAVVTKARLATVPVAAETGALLMDFDSIERAMEAVPSIRESDPSAIEFLDESFLELLRKYRPDLSPMLPPRGHCLLLVEHEAGDFDSLRHNIDMAERTARDAGVDAVESAADPSGVEKLWSLRKAGSPIISSMPGPKRPIRFVEDMVVPPERLAGFIGKFSAILRRHDCMAPIIGHAGDGNLHVNPLLDPRSPGVAREIERIADEVYGVVADFDGSLSGEHGDGRLRAKYLRRSVGPIYGIFERIKDIFDPKGILNPGVKISDVGITDNLRFPLFIMDMGRAIDTPARLDRVERCHGCGLCRSVCPLFEIHGGDEYSPRGKVALTRVMAEGRVNTKSPATASLKRLLDECLLCGRCDEGCPSMARPPDLVIGARSSAGADPADTVADNLLKNPRKWMPILSKSGKPGRFAQKLVGVIQRSRNLAAPLGFNPDRPLPEISSQSLKNLADDYKITRSRYDVVYFPGCHATFVDPVGTGMTALSVLDAIGKKTVIATFGCCGMPQMASGRIVDGLNTLAESANALRDAPVAPIVTSCPSCAMMLRGTWGGEVPRDLVELGGRVSGIATYLARWIPEDALGSLDRSLRAAYHAPCHGRGSGEDEAMLELLRRIPNLELIELPDLCCGMGGTFGMKARNREPSGRVGDALLRYLAESGAEIALSPCGACRVALGTIMETRHPINILAAALSRGSEEEGRG